MGMTGQLIALKAALVADAPRAPRSAPRLDIDKAWHGIHFLLTGEVSTATPPLGDAVMGGTPVGEDEGYGPARLLSAEQVKAVAEALKPLTREIVAARFDAEAMANAQVYPSIWDEGEGALDYLMMHYDELRAFYLRAAKRGDAVLVSVT